MPTIIMKGGLGNQLFQYAVGRHISERTDTQLYMDTQDISKERDGVVEKREFLLDKFDIEGKVKKGRISKYSNKIKRYIAKNVNRWDTNISPSTLGVYIEKDARVFSPKVLKLPGSTLLDGYFQTEKYFNDISGLIKNEVSIENKTSKKSKLTEKSGEYLAVHIRRGDYKELDWQLPVSYYYNSISYVRKKEKFNGLFLFSDDAKWVRQNISDIVPSELTHKTNIVRGNKPYMDLMLMSKAKHNIISNSTFGWWGAWLNECKGKTVVAPHKWIRKRTCKLDIIPKSWTVKKFS